MTTTGTEADQSPRLSVVVPVYNRAHTVAATLRSLAPAVRQGAEVIVVDDGSDDASVEVVERTVAELDMTASIRVLQQDNAGPGAARNAGVAAARSPWIAFLDSDDLWLPWTFPTLMEAIERSDPPRAVFLRTQVFTEVEEIESFAPGAPQVRRHDTMLDMQLAPDRLALIGSCNFAVRRDTLEATGGFTHRTFCGEDSDLFYRMGDIGPVDSIASPSLVAFRNDGSDALGRNLPAVARGAIFLLRQEHGGAYGAPSKARRAALAQSTAYTVHRLLRLGYPALAYKLLWHGRRVMLEGRRYRQIARLLGTPVLSVIRPGRHAFRWRPLRDGEGPRPGPNS